MTKDIDTNSSKELGISPYRHLDLEGDASEALKDVYADWADKYDHDNDHILKTVSQPNSVAMMMRHCQNKQAKILDVGCGTGIVGAHLSHHGFTHYDGTDPSLDMMAHAKARGYQNLFPLTPNQPLSIADNSYDATLCVGVFTHGHLGPEGFDELLRVTKPKGLICFTVNEGVWESGGFNAAIQTYIDQGHWRVLEMTRQDYMINEGVQAYYVAAQKV